MDDQEERRLQAAAWTVCCDFHDDPIEIEAHLKRWEAEYGRTKAGMMIKPPAGWRIVPYRTVVPQEHREYDEIAGWLQPRRGWSTMTPIFTRPAGRTRAFAEPADRPERVNTQRPVMGSIQEI